MNQHPNSDKASFETVRYRNDFIEGVCLLPKEDYDENGNLTLESRRLHRLFMQEENDTVAAGYREAVRCLADGHLVAANKAGNEGDDDLHHKEMMRHFYAMHCFAKMQL